MVRPGDYGGGARVMRRCRRATCGSKQASCGGRWTALRPSTLAMMPASWAPRLIGSCRRSKVLSCPSTRQSPRGRWRRWALLAVLIALPYPLTELALTVEWASLVSARHLAVQRTLFSALCAVHATQASWPPAETASRDTTSCSARTCLKHECQLLHSPAATPLDPACRRQMCHTAI